MTKTGISKTVYASATRSLEVPSPSQAQKDMHCDELLDWWVSEARRHGVASQRVVIWIRRKIGGDMAVVRYRSDGTLGCAVPCVMCQKELRRFDLRVHCCLGGNDFFNGRLNELGAPQALLTAGQRRMFKREK